MAVADLVGAQICADRACWANKVNRHHDGYAADGVVHWIPRGSTRRGLWNFLKLVAETKLGEVSRVELIWRRAIMAYSMGLSELGIRFPREYADMDRAQARAALADGTLWDIDADTRRKITRWASD